MEIKKCNKCGKSLTNKKGTTIIGLQFIIRNNEATKEDEKFIQKQLGDYKINKEYNICFECNLKAYGIKP